jgi:hypothetical protein
MTDPTTPTPRPVSRGILINRGTTFGISNLRLTIGPDGAIESDTKFTLSLDLTPYWLEIAVAHARQALANHADLLDVFEREGQARIDQAMEAECKASMQAFAAAAIALDAFYARVKEDVPISSELVGQWRAKRAARYKQIAEVFRRGFRVGPRSAVLLRKHIREIFEWRDRTVHPPSTAGQPVFYEELSVGTEWRFVAFRAHNARLIAGTALSIVAQLLTRPRSEHAALSKYCVSALANVQPTLDAWEKEFGVLFDRSVASDPV